MNVEKVEQEMSPHDFRDDVRTRIDTLIQNVRARPLSDTVSKQALEQRKQNVEKLLQAIGEQAPKLLDSFEDICKKHLGRDAGFLEIALYVVGGNAYGGTFEETSDVDIAFASDPPLNPLDANASISYAQRHEIARELFEQAAQLLQTANPEYETGDLEIKAYGEETPAAMAKRQEEQKDVIRVLSKVWQR